MNKIIVYFALCLLISCTSLKREIINKDKYEPVLTSLIEDIFDNPERLNNFYENYPQFACPDCKNDWTKDTTKIKEIIKRINDLKAINGNLRISSFNCDIHDVDNVTSRFFKSNTQLTSQNLYFMSIYNYLFTIDQKSPVPIVRFYFNKNGNNYELFHIDAYTIE